MSRLQLGARHIRQAHGAGETLVLLRVVVLETNLELDGLGEATLLLLRKSGRQELSSAWVQIKIRYANIKPPGATTQSSAI